MTVGVVSTFADLHEAGTAPTSRKGPLAHGVNEVHFAHGKNSQLAPMSCNCGWTGTVAEYEEHRKETR